MLIKFFKIFSLILLLIYQSSVYSKSKDINEFNSKNLSSYFSALVSYDNQKNIDALNFFKSSNSLINTQILKRRDELEKQKMVPVEMKLSNWSKLKPPLTYPQPNPIMGW